MDNELSITALLRNERGKVVDIKPVIPDVISAKHDMQIPQNNIMYETVFGEFIKRVNESMNR